jgi:hypothetical protein
MGDLRPGMAEALAAFGLPATVTRPAPDDAPIATTGFWTLALEESQPFGTDLRRREPRQVFVLPRSTVPTLPRGTRIAASDLEGGAVKQWMVDGLDRAVDIDHWRAILVVTS